MAKSAPTPFTTNGNKDCFPKNGFPHQEKARAAHPPAYNLDKIGELTAKGWISKPVAGVAPECIHSRGLDTRASHAGNPEMDPVSYWTQLLQALELAEDFRW